MKWTISKAVIEWKINPKTLKQALVENGHTIAKGAEFTTLEISGAIYGDLERERTLETREKRKMLERENAEQEGMTIRMDEAQKLYAGALIPVRQRLLAMPSECATRANPTDPQMAREELQRWVDRALPLIRDGLPKPK